MIIYRMIFFHLFNESICLSLAHKKTKRINLQTQS